MTKESEKNVRSEGYVHYLDCGDVFTGILSFSSCTYVKTSQAAVLNMCSSLHVNFTSVKKCITNICNFLATLCILGFIHVILSVSS